jgi:tetraacyldisaccharide 4'-kinase
MKWLKVFEKIYHFVSGSKNVLYENQVLEIAKLNVPVVSIGNLSFGGVGKTPCIIMLANEFQGTHRVNIVCRSYKANLKTPQKVDLNQIDASRTYGDEACMLQSKLPFCKVWSGPQKLDTARASLVDNPTLILVDDGFSHRKLSRNFDLVLIDATVGFDTYLRESKHNLTRANAVLITKINMAQKVSVNKIEEKIIQLAPNLKNNIYTSSVRTTVAIDRSNPILVFCALARPEAFVQDLEQQGYNVIEKMIYPDHHAYSDLEQKKIYAKYLDLKNVNRGLKIVTTEKDAIKLTHAELKSKMVVADHRMLLEEQAKEALIEKIRESL